MLIVPSRRSQIIGPPWGLEFRSVSFMFDLVSTMSNFPEDGACGEQLQGRQWSCIEVLSCLLILV